jgi:type I restriction enzyme S subunit
MRMAANGATWAKMKVENLVEYITVGFVGSMSSLFVEEGVPLLRGQNIHPYSLDLTNLKYISQETHRKWKKSALKPGDVVIVCVGYPGTACVIPEGVGDLNAASLVIGSPNPALLDSKFLSYVINSPWGKAQVAGRLVGAAQQVFNTQTAAELEIPAPPLPVQRRIAGILSPYDELIENSQRRIKILEAMARALYREWFVHFRFPGHDNPAGQPDWTAAGRPAGASATDGARQSVPRVQSPLGDVPQGWEVKTFANAAVFENGDRGKNYPNGSDFVDEGIPFINAGHLADGGVEFASMNYILADKFDQLLSGKIRKGDLLYCLRGSPDRTARTAGLDRNAIASSLVSIRPSELTNETFLYYTLADEIGKRMAVELDNGAAQPNVSVGSIQKYPLLLPPKNLLDEFELAVEPFWGQKDVLRAQVSSLKRQRDLLLPRLLSGQIDVEAMPS